MIIAVIIILFFFLSFCPRRYRFVELYYRRAESVRKGRTIPARVETVVIYLPDVRSCVPTRLEWDALQITYKHKLDQILGQNENAAAAAAAAAVAENGNNRSGKNSVKTTGGGGGTIKTLGNSSENSTKSSGDVAGGEGSEADAANEKALSCVPLSLFICLSHTHTLLSYKILYFLRCKLIYIFSVPNYEHDHFRRWFFLLFYFWQKIEHFCGHSYACSARAEFHPSLPTIKTILYSKSKH